MKASPSHIMNHPKLTNEQKAIGILARFALLKTWAHDSRDERINFGLYKRLWQLEKECTEAWKSLDPFTHVTGETLLKALDFHGYRVFIRDPSGSIFPVYSCEEYCLENDKIRVVASRDKEYDYEDLKIASVLMHGSVHRSVKGTKVLLLNVNRLTFRCMYPTVREL